MSGSSCIRSRRVLRYWRLGMALASLLCASAAFAEPRESDEPRLALPGGYAVCAGQFVALRWSPADSISELEILVSFDGGRHYSQCISPRLDPSRCGFRWRVPEVRASAIRLRIRYNRHGKEIEGPPTASVALRGSSENDPEPLGLPPDGADADSHPGGANPISTTNVAFSATENVGRSECRPRVLASGFESSCRAVARPPGAGTGLDRGASPRFVPLRT